MNKRIILIVVVTIAAIAGVATALNAKASNGDWPTEPVTLADHQLITAPAGNGKTAVWCWYKFNNGQEHTVYGGQVDTNQLNSGYIHFGCQK